jgi:predicted DNA-binding transcriptional regulator|tara:strand:- start:3 stop:227 length:225 start_codon:yes stop_codon:yes gene_type:complete
MQRRSGIGIMIFVLAIGAFFVYAYLLMLSEWSPIVLQLTILMIVGGILGVVSWIGYMMATTSAKPTSSVIDDDT